MSQITTHILDTSTGRPARNVSLALARQTDQGWQEIASASSDSDGRATGLLGADVTLNAGVYKMFFDTAGYYKDSGTHCFYPWVEVVFSLAGSGEHYHIPLLLSPFGYSTYRGS